MFACCCAVFCSYTVLCTRPGVSSKANRMGHWAKRGRRLKSKNKEGEIVSKLMGLGKKRNRRRVYEDIGVLLKETGQSAKGEWEKERGRGRGGGGCLLFTVSGFRAF